LVEAQVVSKSATDRDVEGTVKRFREGAPSGEPLGDIEESAEATEAAQRNVVNRWKIRQEK
jgi:hypothetical protein